MPAVLIAHCFQPIYYDSRAADKSVLEIVDASTNRQAPY